jgi:hypothetical protein
MSDDVINGGCAVYGSLVGTMMNHDEWVRVKECGNNDHMHDSVNSKYRS